MSLTKLNHYSGFGHIKVKDCGDFILLDEIWVDREFRGNGIGNDLLRKAIQFFSPKEIWLDPQAFDQCPMNDYQLENWYRRNGFEWNLMGTYMVHGDKNAS